VGHYRLRQNLFSSYHLDQTFVATGFVALPHHDSASPKVIRQSGVKGTRNEAWRLALMAKPVTKPPILWFNIQPRTAFSQVYRYFTPSLNCEVNRMRDLS
jgi:hypothetical protein